MALYFVGRNYVEHVKELSNNVPDEPVIFCKPESTLKENNILYIPSWSDEVHFEGEIVFRYSKGEKYVVSCGIDYTARDIQRDLKAKGLPWFKAKCFKGSTAVSFDFVTLTADDVNILSIETYKNGVLKQKGFYRDMIFKIDTIFSHIETMVDLNEGDLVFTGTPAGVERVNTGDTVEVFLKSGDKTLVSLRSEVR